MSTGVKDGNVSGIYNVRSTFDVASVAAATSVQQTVTVQGVVPGDMCFVSNATHTAGLVYGACAVVTAANSVSVTIANVTAGALDPASQTLTFLVIRSELGTAGTIVAD